MTTNRFAIEWLKAFRSDPVKVSKMYSDDFLFEDLMLDQSITDFDDLVRAFSPYANTDPDNGVGLHYFRIDEVIGNDKIAFYRWSWKAVGCAIFLGYPTNGQDVTASGHTVHIYDEDGRIKRESTYWDAAQALSDLGLPISKQGVTAPIVDASAAA